MVILNMDKVPTGCTECDLCDNRSHFDGNEWISGCRYLCKPVSDDGERDEDCPFIGEISDKEYRLIKTRRETLKHMEERKKWRQEHELPEPKVINDIGIPVYLD